MKCLRAKRTSRSLSYLSSGDISRGGDTKMSKCRWLILGSVVVCMQMGFQLLLGGEYADYLESVSLQKLQNNKLR